VRGKRVFLKLHEFGLIETVRLMNEYQTGFFTEKQYRKLPITWPLYYGTGNKLLRFMRQLLERYIGYAQASMENQTNISEPQVSRNELKYQ